jgi:hypothetical protein
MSKKMIDQVCLYQGKSLVLITDAKTTGKGKTRKTRYTFVDLDMAGPDVAIVEDKKTTRVNDSPGTFIPVEGAEMVQVVTFKKAAHAKATKAYAKAAKDAEKGRATKTKAAKAVKKRKKPKKMAKPRRKKK